MSLLEIIIAVLFTAAIAVGCVVALLCALNAIARILHR